MHGDRIEPKIPKRGPGQDGDLTVGHRNDDDDRSLGVERQATRLGLVLPGRIHRFRIVRCRGLARPRRLDYRDVVRLLRGLLQFRDLSGETFVSIGNPGRVDALPIEFGKWRLRSCGPPPEPEATSITPRAINATPPNCRRELPSLDRPPEDRARVLCITITMIHSARVPSHRPGIASPEERMSAHATSAGRRPVMITRPHARRDRASAPGFR